MPIVRIQQQPERYRVLIASLPKAGTYLVAEILKALGYRTTGMHLFDLGFTDYSQTTLEQARTAPAELHREMELSESIQRVTPGLFAVGHLAHKPSVLECTRGFNYLFLQRELRSCLVSYLRFYRKTKRNFADAPWMAMTDDRQQTAAFLRARGEFLVRNRYEPMLGWKTHPYTLPVRFEDLTDSEPAAVETVEAIACHLDLPAVDGQQILEMSLAADTITKLPERTRLEDFWSDESEDWFVGIGGDALNTRLGYAKPWGRTSRSAA